MKKFFIFFILFFAMMSIGLALHLIASLLLLKREMGKKTDNLAVIYFLTIAIKFVVYITFFYPKFNFDGELNRQEFFIFFIPYTLGLIFEISLLAKNHN